MEKWKKINIVGIAKIEKCVAEFNIWELNISPYAKFKIKIFESSKGEFSGYSNIQILDEMGDYYCAIGHGISIEAALQDTLNNFFQLTSRKKATEWTENDFNCSDSFDF